MKNRLAVFDIDGTVFRSSLLIELIEELVRRRIYSSSATKEIERDYLAWVDRKGSYEDYLGKVVEVHYRCLPGVRATDVRKASLHVIRMQKNRVYRYTRDLIHRLRKTHVLLAISGSPSDIVAEFARAFRFDAAYGRIFATDSRGRYTGHVANEIFLKDKRKMVERFLEERKLSLRGSIGVGDTEVDIPFLERVERPIAFNPNNRLYRIAKRRRWRIVVERKDVVFHIA